MAGKNFRKMRLQWKSRFLKWILISTALASFVEIWLLGTLQISDISIPFTHPPSVVVGFVVVGKGGGGGRNWECGDLDLGKGARMRTVGQK